MKLVFFLWNWMIGWSRIWWNWWFLCEIGWLDDLEFDSCWLGIIPLVGFGKFSGSLCGSSNQRPSWAMRGMSIGWGYQSSPVDQVVVFIIICTELSPPKLQNDHPQNYRIHTNLCPNCFESLGHFILRVENSQPNWWLQFQSSNSGWKAATAWVPPDLSCSNWTGRSPTRLGDQWRCDHQKMGCIYDMICLYICIYIHIISCIICNTEKIIDDRW